MQQPEPKRTGLVDYSAQRCGKHVTVYCWSRSEPGTERWEQAEKLGRTLAQRGFGIVNGGYCGSMEAVSKGARLAGASNAPTSPSVPFADIAVGAGRPVTDHVQNGSSETKSFEQANEGAQQEQETTTSMPSPIVEVRGVLVPGQFPDRVLRGNEFLTQSIDAANMCQRMELLSSLTRYYIVLPGTGGTLTELAIIWQNCALHAKGMERPVILCWRDPWERMVAACKEILGLAQEYCDCLHYVDSVEEAVAKIEDDWVKSTAQKK